jgi:hypothetical protein
MADYFLNLDTAANPPSPSGPPLSLDPNYRPVVSHPDPTATDAGLQHLAELGLQVGLPAGLAALGGPMSVLGLRTLGPAVSAMIAGPLDSAGIGKPKGMPDNMLQGAVPNPEQAELTAAQVLAEAAGKNKLSYADWQQQNPGAESGMFDFKGAQPPRLGPKLRIFACSFWTTRSCKLLYRGELL